MKHIAKTLALAVLTSAATLAFDSRADDKHKDHKDAKAKPYPLKTCVVSGEEINDKGSMKPHVFTHNGQEVKLCCKSCLKDFNKEPAKFLKKIEDAAKPGKK